eukprot:scaffold82236_cov32-Phaeocystis_antarctica.AAC.1
MVEARAFTRRQHQLERRGGPPGLCRPLPPCVGKGPALPPRLRGPGCGLSALAGAPRGCSERRRVRRAPPSHSNRPLTGSAVPACLAPLESASTSSYSRLGTFSSGACFTARNGHCQSPGPITGPSLSPGRSTGPLVLIPDPFPRPLLRVPASPPETATARASTDGA